MAEPYDFRAYFRRLGWGVLVGLISAVGAFIFIGLMDAGMNLVWPDPPSWQPFSGPWSIVIIMTVTGLFAGLVHHFAAAQQMDVFEALDTGRLDPKPVPASLLVSLLSLIGGFSLGPEVPTGMWAAGFCSWLSERRALDEETRRTNVLSGVSAAYGGLFSSPFAALVMVLEAKHKQTLLYYGVLFVTGLAAVIGFAVFYVLGGNSFSPLFGLVQPQAYELRLWHVLAGILFGFLALPVALTFQYLLKLLKRLVAPLNNQPILRGLLGGLLLGLLGMALPLTLFLGTDGLSTTTSQAAEIGVALLLLFAVAKLVALTGALSFGFIGGPIFPLLFVGATLGSAVNLLFPQIPLGLAVGCMMAAVPGAVVPIPLALAVIVVFVVGLPPENVPPVVLASLSSFTIAHGLGLFLSGRKQTATTA